MSTVEATIDIQAPPGLVFAVITDPKRGREWNDNIVDIQEVSPYPVTQGTTWRQVTSLLSRPATLHCRIAEWNPPHEGVLEITGPQTARITTRCAPYNGGTRVTQILDFVVPGGALGKLASKAVGPKLHAELMTTLQRQREILEGEATTRDSSGGL